MQKPDRYRETITQFNLQRKKLGMSCATLARRSGVSVPTVNRILSGEQSSAHFDHVLAIADALGLNLQTHVAITPQDMKKIRAAEKAEQLVRLVQGTSAMEAQAVDNETLRSMIEQTTYELLAGSPRNLWAD